MSETLSVPTGVSKREKYEQLVPQITSLIRGEPDLIANLANITAALREGMGFFWVGFYLVKKSLKASAQNPHGELVLGPFQGPIACTRIAYGRGVCGKSWETSRTLIVPDVAKFPGHIACSSQSRSEIVLPFYLQPDLEGQHRQVMGVLDVDSTELAAFDEVDEACLSQVLALLIG